MIKQNSINILFLIGVLLVLYSCEYDNYDSPSAGIQGTVIDAITGEPFQSEQPGGYRIRLIEQGYDDPVPIDFWGRADGTFEHSKLFPAHYQVVPIEGAFFPADTAVVEVHQTGKEVHFTVTPFLSISASAEHISDNRVVVHYTLTRDQAADKILYRQILASKYPAVSNNVFDHRIRTNLSEIPDEEVLNVQFTDTLEGLQSGQTYYIRASAQTDNFLGRDNYSEIFEIDIP
jgi:hypothetical protein